MTYATKADLIARFGEAELVAFTDRADPPNGAVDDSVVDQALGDADSEINTFLAARIATPVAPVPGIVNLWACVIARYRLSKDLATDRITNDYAAAVKAMQMFANGTTSLGDDGPTPPPTGSSPKFKGHRPRFTRKSMEDF